MKRFRARSGIIGGSIGIVLGFLVATYFSVSDWKLNPGGIFRDENGTVWAIVFETAISWFVPVALLTSILATAIHIWLAPVRDQDGF